MKATEQTIQQIERVLRKIANKLPEVKEPTLMTDIHLRVPQDSGEILVYDDDDNEITRCVVEQWIENKDEDFYDQITEILRKRHIHIGLFSLLKERSINFQDVLRLLYDLSLSGQPQNFLLL